jgi:tetratricopeptide (TPR) repeat protein
MRVSTLALGAGFILASLPTASNARADHDIFPHSLELLEQGVAAQKAADLNKAIDYYEAALVADPRNRTAIIALAQVARVQGLPGKAIGLYREALTLEPNDVTALVGQGEALADKGALDKAKERLAEAQKLCANSCGQLASLERAIAAGSAKKMATAEAQGGTAGVMPITPPVVQN